MDTNEKEDHNPFPDRNPADQSVKWMRKIRRQRGSKSTEPDIMQVRSICKLATVECYYHNVAKSEKPAGTGIWHFGEKDRQFWIEYTGTVKLGIDMSKVQMKVNGTDVTVTIPEAEVQQVNVDDDSYNSDSYIFSEDGINKMKLLRKMQPVR